MKIIELKKERNFIVLMISKIKKSKKVKFMTDELQKKIVWQNINSSKEKGKILKGKIIAIETEKMKLESIVCAIIDFYGIKVLIPATEISKEFNNDKKLLRNMMGAEIRFIIVEADRISEKAVGSRIKAMERLNEINMKKIVVGDKIYAQGVDTVCTLPNWLDRPPLVGENVIIKIYKIIPEKRKIYSSLVKIIGSDVVE